MRVAIIRLSALGDIIVSAVFLPYLKSLYPNAQIHWFVDDRFGDILDNCPYIDVAYKLPFKKIFHNPFSLYKLYKILRKHEKYDIVIDIQGLLKSAIIGGMLKKDKFIGYDKNSIREKFACIFYNQTVSIPYQSNILKRNSKLIFEAFQSQPALIESLSYRKDAFKFSKHAEEKINSLFLREKKKLVLFVLEASVDNKAYPIENYISLTELLKDLDIKILLLFHQHFQRAKDIYDQIHSYIDTEILPVLNLDELKSLIARMDLVIGGDTGVVHLAWAMQRPSITLYGNTPMKRFELFGDKNISLSSNSEANYDKNDFSIQTISPKAIQEAIRKIL